MSRLTVGVEPIGATLRALLTRERGTHAVVLRGGERPLILGTGSDPQRLAEAAAELALTYADGSIDHDATRCWACCPPLAVVRGCLDCQTGARPTLATVDGRLVPYWTHRVEPATVHAARVGGYR